MQNTFLPVDTEYNYYCTNMNAVCLKTGYV